MNQLESWFLEDFSLDVAERVLYNKIKAAEWALVEVSAKPLFLSNRYRPRGRKF